MTHSDARPVSPAALTIAGLALILAPIIAVVLKLGSIGWLMVIALWTLTVPAILLLGWALQIVIAATGFFGRRSCFAGASSARRAIAAAWTTSVGALLLGLVLVDGGDTAWGSTLMYWTGTASDDAIGAISSTVTWIALVPWLGGWVWLLVEWIAALVRRSRARAR